MVNPRDNSWGMQKKKKHAGFLRSSHACGLNVGTVVATLLGAWCSRVSDRTGRPGASAVCLSETASLIASVSLRVVASGIVTADQV